MDALLNILKGVAPTLATAVAGPLGGAAVSFIADKLGVDDKTVEGVTAALQGNPEALEKLRAMELEFAKVDAEDRNSARTREVQIATSAATPFINKSVTPMLALTVVLVWGLVQWFMFTHVIPQEMRELIARILGTLDGALMLVLSYYFGASHDHKTDHK